MNENIEKFILKLEPILNERDEKIKKREELIKDVNEKNNVTFRMVINHSTLKKWKDILIKM